MAALSWNEVKDRAVRFSKEWENETSEDAEAKSFLDIQSILSLQKFLLKIGNIFL